MKHVSGYIFRISEWLFLIHIWKTEKIINLFGKVYAVWTWPENDPKSSQNTDYLDKRFEILDLIHCQNHIIWCFQMMDDFEKSLIHHIMLFKTLKILAVIMAMFDDIGACECLWSIVGFLEPSVCSSYHNQSGRCLSCHPKHSWLWMFLNIFW